MGVVKRGEARRIPASLATFAVSLELQEVRSGNQRRGEELNVERGTCISR
jgi:hypothetical protein